MRPSDCTTMPVGQSLLPESEVRTTPAVPKLVSSEPAGGSAVVKLQECCAASALPARSCAAVVIVAVQSSPGASALAGVNVATGPLQATLPAIGAPAESTSRKLA